MNVTKICARTPPRRVRACLLQQGYEPVACVGKRPVGKKWQSKEITGRSLANDAAGNPRARNTGVRTGRIVGLDLDIRDGVVLDDFKIRLSMNHGIKMSEYRRIGNAPKEMFVFRLAEGEELPKKMAAKYREDEDTDSMKHGVEILGKGQQFIVDGIHPDTDKHYGWPEKHIVEVRPEELPSMSRATMELIISEFRAYCEEQEWIPETSGNASPISDDYVAEDIPSSNVIWETPEQCKILGALVEHYEFKPKGDGWWTGKCIDLSGHTQFSKDGREIENWDGGFDVRPPGVDSETGEAHELNANCNHTHTVKTNALIAFMKDKHGIDVVPQETIDEGKALVASFEEAKAKQEQKMREQSAGEQQTPDDEQQRFRKMYAEQVLSGGDFLKNTNPVSWLIRKWIPESGTVRLFGDPGSFKTYIALDIGCHLGAGMPWHGSKVLGDEKHRVLYVVGEGCPMVRDRFEAWCLFHKKRPDDVLVSFVTVGIEMDDDKQFTKYKIFLNLFREQHGDYPDMVVFDTVTRNSSIDQNNNQDLSKLLKRVEGHGNECKYVTIWVAHSGHANKERAMGGMAALGMIDTEIRCSANNGMIRAEQKKQKGAAEISADFVLSDPIFLPGTDSDGESKEPNVVMIGSDSPGQDERVPLKKEKVPGGQIEAIYMLACEMVGVDGTHGYSGALLANKKVTFSRSALQDLVESDLGLKEDAARSVLSRVARKKMFKRKTTGANEFGDTWEIWIDEKYLQYWS